MTTLNVILDDMLTTAPGGSARYTRELASALIDHAPNGCFVEGIVAASTEDEYRILAERLPGLAGLFKSALVRRDLTRAWQHGFTSIPSGMLHAPTLFAPLRRHDRVNDKSTQVVVTIHDAIAWTHPDYLAPREVSWTKAMAIRAVKHADAVVVPTHAVAGELDELLGLGDRMRVIGSAVSRTLLAPDDVDERTERLGLPKRYLVTVGDSGPKHGIGSLLAALRDSADTELVLVVIGAERAEGDLGAAVAAAGVDEKRVVALGPIDDADYAAALSGATALVYPGLGNGFGTPVLEAFSLGTPVIHAATPSLVEIAGEAGVPIDVDDAGAFPGLLTEAIDRVVGDAELRTTLSILGEDRARLFTWRAVADGVWQLHADL